MNLENKKQILATQSHKLAQEIKQWGQALGFADIGITTPDLSQYEPQHFNWLKQQFHGEMDYMAKHGTKRTRPAELEPGTVSIISCRLNYFDGNATSPIQQLHTPSQAYVSRYALNKDYHKLIRKRLQQLAHKINESLAEYFPNFQYRAFSDSAPVLERPLAEKAGLGFIGKNSLIIHPRAGSWFFLGEIYLNLPLPADAPFEKQGCGPCTACIDECPTQAIVDHKVVDARRCISYLTIEYKGSIDEALRPLMGNRIYGCDDCQLVCPWNKFTQPTQEIAFHKSAQHLDSANLLDLLAWNETQFLKRLEGSPIRRIGFEQWQRNLCIAIGNLNTNQTEEIHTHLTALKSLKTESSLVKEHQQWAIKQLNQKINSSQKNNQKLSKTPRPGTFLTKNKPAIAKKYYLPKSES